MRPLGLSSNPVRCLKAGVLCIVLASICFAHVQLDSISLKRPVRRISGRVVDYGAVNPGVNVQVFNHPEVWSDDSLSLAEKREKQSMIASVVTDDSGKFEFRKIGKGSYEVLFSKVGWDTVSALVAVEPSATTEQFCVKMPISGAGYDASVRTCQP